MDAHSASGSQKGPDYGRRLLWLGVFVVLLFGGYSAGWYYVADLLEEKALDAIDQMNEGEVVAECADPVVRGFPFRFGLHCDGVRFADPSQGVGLAAESFRSAAQVYDLSRFVAELDGPARLDLPRTAPLAIDWQGLRASARLGEPLPERLSLEAKALTAKLVAGAPLASLSAFEAHLRPNGGNLDLAARFGGLRLDPAALPGSKLPEFSGQADLSITGGVDLMKPGASLLRGRSGTLRTLSLTTAPDMEVRLSGPFSVASDGLLDAEFTLTVRDPQGLAALLGDAFPEARQQIDSSLSGLPALGPEPSLPLHVVRGSATLGFIPLGDIPAL